MTEKIYKKVVVDNGDREHLFEVFHIEIENKAPYMIMVDGDFYCTAESGHEIAEEIEDTMNWYGWKEYSLDF